MLSMQDYINNIKQQNIYNNLNSNIDKQSTTSDLSLNLKSDSFEKKDNKINKKKIFKIGALITGIVLVVLAFLKRKQIGNILSDLFNKKSSTQSPAPPLNGVPNNPKTPPIEPPKKPIQAINSLTSDINNSKLDNSAEEIIQETVQIVSEKTSPTLEEYTRLRKEFNEKLRKLDISDPTRKAAAKKLKEMERQMIEQNISFVSKAPESFASEKERWDYFYKGIDANVRNEASAMDILDQFSRLGGRMYDKNTGRRSIADIGTAVLIYANEKATSIESSNRILQKYVDSVFKFATNEIPPRGYSPDAAELLPAYNNSIKVMTKDTVIKFINAFKNIAVDKQQYIDIKYFLQDGIWQSFYPQLKPQDLPDIQKALDEFAKAVENLPYDIMKIN